MVVTGWQPGQSWHQSGQQPWQQSGDGQPGSSSDGQPRQQSGDGQPGSSSDGQREERCGWRGVSAEMGARSVQRQLRTSQPAPLENKCVHNSIQWRPVEIGSPHIYTYTWPWVRDSLQMDPGPGADVYMWDAYRKGNAPPESHESPEGNQKAHGWQSSRGRPPPQ